MHTVIGVGHMQQDGATGRAKTENCCRLHALTHLHEERGRIGLEEEPGRDSLVDAPAVVFLRLEGKLLSVLPRELPLHNRQFFWNLARSQGDRDSSSKEWRKKGMDELDGGLGLLDCVWARALRVQYVSPPGAPGIVPLLATTNGFIVHRLSRGGWYCRSIA